MQSINPTTQEIVHLYQAFDDAQVEQCLRRAGDAFDPWRNTSLQRRADLLNAVAARLREQRQDLARLITAEMGKPLAEAAAEIDKCALAAEHFARFAAQYLHPVTLPSDASQSCVRYDPLGAVLAVMPWNFPFWQVFRFAAPALMAGNVAVLKHAPNVCGCSLAIERLFREAGCPQGVFTSLLIPNEKAEAVIRHPVIRAVTLTGSERAGMAVAAQAGSALKKTVMELGGSDPFIVLADMDPQEAAIAATAARCINAGQSCIAAKRFIVEAPIARAFEEAFAANMAAIKVGDPLDATTRMGPLARRDLREGLEKQVQSSIAAGAIALTGGHALPGKGFYYAPTVLTRVRPGMAVFDEETFGPVGAVIAARDAEEAVALANQSNYGLGASIWTRDTPRAMALAQRINAGNVFINGPVKSDPRLPFGGIKNSGWGRELAAWGIHEFVNVKTVWVK